MTQLTPRQPRTPAMIRASYDRIGAALAPDGSPPGSPCPARNPTPSPHQWRTSMQGGLRVGERPGGAKSFRIGRAPGDLCELRNVGRGPNAAAAGLRRARFLLHAPASNPVGNPWREAVARSPLGPLNLNGLRRFRQRRPLQSETNG
jgi:hypothetical protein